MAEVAPKDYVAALAAYIYHRDTVKKYCYWLANNLFKCKQLFAERSFGHFVKCELGSLSFSGDAALQWLLAPWPHSRIGCGFNLHVPPVCSRLLSRDSAASSRSPNTRTWGQLLVRVSVSADGCLSLCIGPVVNRQVVLGVTPPSPRDSWDYAPAPLRAWELEKRWWKIEKKENKHQWVGNSC